MSKVININKARKSRDRTARKQQADENAVLHGRSKAEKARDQARADKELRHLDGHKTEE